jgi:hypothetical protein
VETPLQVTCPCSKDVEQLGFTAVQLVLALEQVRVLPSRQVTVAVQVFSFWTTEAKRISPAPVGQAAPANGSPRIAARTSSETGPGPGESANPAAETKSRVQMAIHVFFTILSSFSKLTSILKGASRGRE